MALCCVILYLPSPPMALPKSAGSSGLKTNPSCLPLSHPPKTPRRPQQLASRNCVPKTEFQSGRCDGKPTQERRPLEIHLRLVIWNELISEQHSSFVDLLTEPFANWLFLGDIDASADSPRPLQLSTQTPISCRRISCAHRVRARIVPRLPKSATLLHTPALYPAPTEVR